MARLVLTNVLKKHEFILRRNITGGLGDYVVKRSNVVFLAAHKKRKVKTTNFHEFENGDFVCAVGTCIYKGFFGQDALEAMYRDFDGRVEALRVNAVGNYLIAIKKNQKLVVFVDKYQILKAYYFNKNGEWLLANSLADVASVIEPKVINEFRLAEQVFTIATVEKETIYDGIFQLYGNEFIIIDLKSGKFEVQEIPYSRRHWDNQSRSLEEITDEYAKMVKARFAVVTKVFGTNVGLHLTGGLDSRTVFSGFMSVGCKPNIFYGVGDTPLTDTKTADLLANKDYAKEFDLNSYVMNWKSNAINDTSNWDSAFAKYGFEYRIYGASKNLFAEYEGKIPNYPIFFESGYFGENLRLREWAANKKTTGFTLREFVNDYQLAFLKRNPELYPNAKRLAEHLVKQFSKYAEIYGIPNKKGVFNIDQMDELRWITARKSDSIFVNFCNEFTHSISMFSIYDLHEFPFDVPAKYRKDGKFQLMLIDKLYPRALTVPIFSHNREHYYNSKTHTMEVKYPGRIPKRLGTSLESTLRSIGLFKPIKKIFLTKNKNYKTEKINTDKYLRAFLIDFVNNHDEIRSMNFLKVEKFDASDEAFKFMAYVHWLYGINVSKNSQRI